MAEKVFCYVDESGQDTQGILFIVAIVITSHERDQLYEICSLLPYRTLILKDTEKR